MSTKVSNFSDLIQRVTASCLQHPAAAGPRDLAYETQEEEEEEEEGEFHYEDALEEDEETIGFNSKSRGNGGAAAVRLETVKEMEEVFEAASAMKRAYLALQEAHSPWDPQKLQDADVAVMAELKRIEVLRERFRKMMTAGSGPQQARQRLLWRLWDVERGGGAV